MFLELSLFSCIFLIFLRIIVLICFSGIPKISFESLCLWRIRISSRGCHAFLLLYCFLCLYITFSTLIVKVPFHLVPSPFLWLQNARCQVVAVALVLGEPGSLTSEQFLQFFPAQWRVPGQRSEVRAVAWLVPLFLLALRISVLFTTPIASSLRVSTNLQKTCSWIPLLLIFLCTESRTGAPLLSSLGSDNLIFIMQEFITYYVFKGSPTYIALY